MYAKGECVRSSLSSLKYVRSRRTRYRIAIVVSRKVSKSAVVRNRIRRRLYEAIRQLHIVEAYDMVLTAYSEQLAVIPADQLHGMVTDQLIKAGIIGQAPETDPTHAIVETKE